MTNTQDKKNLLLINNLCAEIDNSAILKGVNLNVNAGEIHAIMGPNGSGKSTLSKIIAGHPSYRVTAGEIFFEGVNIIDKEPEERAQLGIFLAFQYPVEIPGVSNADFLRLSCNAIRNKQGLEALDPLSFFSFMTEKLKTVDMDPSFLNRNVNEGFSGGEKKRNEILQMATLEPKLSLLDETDSGLDIDALKVVANGINSLMNQDSAIVLITHYQRLLDYIKPDFIHVMRKGKIIKTGGSSLAKELEAYGYESIIE
uniref:iron-sulfur cluster formation ABC transporter ATP-binding subunit n=1 Tax=Timspurckia oligopyrenoides TaxID=708627 RepID=UPI001FCE0A40|nr:iron-sulfur cluster formation ABC transporter ATP-binding subunit [Timspurckia oligopyrenoides]UNJ17467.1 iron-sulfur cluster formation ABC transporter ATP-binding subunit [Timspurckia oligopyrenoides]